MRETERKIYADPATCKAGTIEEMVGIDLAREIWTTAYLRALACESAPDASTVAEAAVLIYAEHWCNIIEIPPGKRPQAYLRFYNSPDTMAGVEA